MQHFRKSFPGSPPYPSPNPSPLEEEGWGGTPDFNESAVLAPFLINNFLLCRKLFMNKNTINHMISITLVSSMEDMLEKRCQAQLS
jgi:hypothetical protein